MNWIEALILGLVQGLTEFLPVSSSGHLEIGKAILQIEARENLTFSIVVHGATVLSILVVFWRDIGNLLAKSFRLEFNESNSYLLKLLLSMVPVGIVGVFFKDQVESFFTGNLVLVGSMLLITALLLAVTNFIPSKSDSAGASGTTYRLSGSSSFGDESPSRDEKLSQDEPPSGDESPSRGRQISFLDALVIGIAQAFAVMPGLSRSGATISTALFLGINRREAARFSFLMVILPILAANFLDLMDMISSGAGVPNATVPIAEASGTIGWFPLLAGFVAAFASGLFACRWMLSIVRKGKLIYFSIYCLIVGIIAIFAGLF